MNKTNFTLLASVAIILIWGTAFTLVGYTVKHITPAWLVTGRTVIAAIILTIYAYISGYKLPRLTDERWLWFGYMGFIGMAAPFYFMAKGMEEVNGVTLVDSGLAAILVGVMPLITIVLAHFFIKGEQLTWRKSIGFIVGFIGIVTLFLPEPFKWELISHWRSQGLIILTAICYAVLAIIAKRAPQTPSALGASMMLIWAAILSLTWALVSGVPKEMPPVSALTALFALAIGATGFAQILYFKLIKVSGPSLIAKINYVVPICSLAAGIIFLDEPFRLRSVAAMCIIVAGLLIARSVPSEKTG